jgi:hypothetical protein
MQQMRINPDFQKTMARFSLLIIILISIFAGSCSGRKNKLDRRNLIPEKELVSILADIYTADGLLTITKVQQWFPSIDTLSSYFYIIEKHGYSKETLDKTMKYYFIKNPKGLIKIYDQVLAVLSEMESLAEKELILTQSHIPNIWTGREYYSFPDPSGSDSAGFDLNLNKPGIYTLTFTVTLFPDDQSVNPRISTYSSHPDSIATGKRRYIETMGYIKDGQPHTYTLLMSVPANSPLHLRGCFYNFDNLFDDWGKHILIENILLIYTYALV